MTSVVIVDDQSTSRIILEEVVGALDPDIRVASFGSAAGALAWVEHNTPDLVLTDYKMPEMDGIEFIRRLRRLPATADVPIVVVTVVDDKVVRYQALEAGATEVLNKPIDPHECRARCHNLLLMRRQGQVIRNRARWLERQVADATRVLGDREREALRLVASVGGLRNPGGAERQQHTARTALAIAVRLGLPPDTCESIEIATLLRDVGMCGIPDAVLQHPGALDAAGLARVRAHARAGHDLLAGHRSPLLHLAADVALHHHERWNGSGYPAALAADSIPLAARIVAVADVHGALLTARPWRVALAPENARAALAGGRGTLFDPLCIDALFAHLDGSPVLPSVRPALQGSD